MRQIYFYSLMAICLGAAHVSAAKVEIKNTNFTFKHGTSGPLLKFCFLEGYKKKPKPFLGTTGDLLRNTRDIYSKEPIFRVSLAPLALLVGSSPHTSDWQDGHYDAIGISCPGIAYITVQDSSEKEPWEDKGGFTVGSDDTIKIELIQKKVKDIDIAYGVFTNYSEIKK